MEKKMKILVASDHAGFDLKKYLMENLKDFTFEDLGTNSTQSVDYPDFAAKVAEKLPKESSEKNPGVFGLLICGSGQGMAIKANKYSHIRAALCWDHTTARLAREHNNANVLCLGARVLPFTLAKEILEIFVKTEFAGGRHNQRVAKLC
jgi:ribose 5-phosphate isomerase B